MVIGIDYVKSMVQLKVNDVRSEFEARKERSTIPPPLDDRDSLRKLADATSVPQQAERLHMYVQELKEGQETPLEKQTLIKRSRQSMTLAYLRFIWANLGTFVSTLFVAPAAIFVDPLSTAAIGFIFPVLYALLALAIAALFLDNAVRKSKLGALLGFKALAKDERYDWVAGELLWSEDTAKAIQSAQATLGGLPTMFPDVPAPGDAEDHYSAPKTTRIFDLDVAKALLAFSALVYVRDEAYIDGAVAAAAQGDFNLAERHLLQGEKKIREQAQRWGLNYESLTDLGSPHGAYGSVFYSKADAEKPFMVLVFKGTTPTNYAEFLVDCTIKRIDATTFFGGGTVHEGFATSLFPMFGEPGVSAQDGYGQVVYQLKRIAEQIKAGQPSNNSERIPLFLCAHSLGAALASLMFARLLRTPWDLGPCLELRDCYAFGMPCVGDAAFSAHYGAEMLRQVNRPNILWRVVNRNDLVCKIPPGYRNLRRGILGTSTSILNYSHIGALFHLLPRKTEPYKVDTELFHHATRVVVVQEGGTASPPLIGVPEKTWFEKAEHYLQGLCFIQLFLDHKPESYMQHLNQVVVTGQGGPERGEVPAAKVWGAVLHRTLDNDA